MITWALTERPLFSSRQTLQRWHLLEPLQANSARAPILGRMRAAAPDSFPRRRTVLPTSSSPGSPDQKRSNLTWVDILCPQGDAVPVASVTRRQLCPYLLKRSPAPSTQHLSKAWLREAIFFFQFSWEVPTYERNNIFKGLSEGCLFFFRSVITFLLRRPIQKISNLLPIFFFKEMIFFFIREVMATTLLKHAFIASPIAKGFG